MVGKECSPELFSTFAVRVIDLSTRSRIDIQYAIRLDNFLNKVLAPNVNPSQYIFLTYYDLISNALHFITKGKVDSWYANIIAVDPSHQGRGVATMLIDVIFKLVRNDVQLFLLFTIGSHVSVSSQARETGEKLALCAATELNVRTYLCSVVE